MFLLDTNIVSELRRPKPHGGVVAWLRSLSASDVFVSVVTLAELQAGVELVRDHDVPRARVLEDFVDRVESSYGVLPFDAAAARRWARLMHGRPVQASEDAMIAATALVHRLTVATRNVRDFAPLDVPIYDPFGFRG